MNRSHHPHPSMLAGIGLLIGTMMLPGCAGGGANKPTGTVSGTVKRKGQVMGEKITVTFLASDGPSFSGVADSTGFYSLTLNGSKEVPVGTYKISLSPYAPPPSAPEDPAQYFDLTTGGTKVVAQPKSILPSKFANPNTSGIVRDITKGSNTIDIDLPE